MDNFALATSQTDWQSFWNTKTNPRHFTPAVTRRADVRAQLSSAVQLYSTLSTVLLYTAKILTAKEPGTRRGKDGTGSI